MIRSDLEVTIRRKPNQFGWPITSAIRRNDRIRCFVCALVLFAVSSVYGADALRTVAFSGQQAPGLPSGVNFSAASPVAFPQGLGLNDAGQVAFYAILSGTGVDTTNRYTVWSEAAGSLGMVARSGTQAPGTPSGGNYSDFGSVTLNNSGMVAFNGYLSGSGVTTTNDYGIWKQGPGGLALVARQGSLAPGTSGGAVFGSPSGPQFNSSGKVAFHTDLIGSGIDSTNNQGYWSDRSGSLSLIARMSSQADGLPSGVNYSGLSSSLNLNDAGQVAFWGELSGTGVNSANDQGIWSDRSGTLAPVARKGDPAPGTGSGVNFSGNLSGTGAPNFNNAGQTAFGAAMTGTGVNSTNDSGFWSEGSGSLALVAREGDAAPGLSSGVSFSGGFGGQINDAGLTLFSAGLTGSGINTTNDRGIWLETSGSLSLMIRLGDVAPGTPSGVTFSRPISNPNNSFGATLLNNAGQIAFIGYLAGTGVVSTNDEGLWATDRTGLLRLIVREGDVVEVAPGSFRTINSIDSVSMNKLGQISFKSVFVGAGQNDQALFVSSLVAVPEPSALAILSLGLATFLGTLRRDRSS